MAWVALAVLGSGLLAVFLDMVELGKELELMLVFVWVESDIVAEVLRLSGSVASLDVLELDEKLGQELVRIAPDIAVEASQLNGLVASLDALEIEQMQEQELVRIAPDRAAAVPLRAARDAVDVAGYSHSRVA